VLKGLRAKGSWPIARPARHLKKNWAGSMSGRNLACFAGAIFGATKVRDSASLKGIGATSKMTAAFFFQAPSGVSGILGNPLTMMIIVMGIFYVMLILPQQRQRKKVQAMLQALKSGDKVITSSGIYGTVNGIDGEIVILKIADQVKIRIARSAIAQVEASEDAK
jgi:preprotein translocase subunit YajC